MREIFDDVLEQDDASYINNIVQNLSWKYVDQPTTHLKNKHWFHDCKNSEWSNDLVDMIKKGIGLEGVESVQYLFCLAHTYGIEQQSHFDEPALTMVYYPNINWKPEWGGGTLVENTLVEYKGNRVALFSGGEMWHNAQPLSKRCYELRIIVVIQCHIINSNVNRVKWKREELV